MYTMKKILTEPRIQIVPLRATDVILSSPGTVDKNGAYGFDHVENPGFTAEAPARGVFVE